MKQIIQDLKSGATLLEEVPAPSVKAGHVLIKTTRSLVSLGTERMLVEVGKASLIDKARQQPDKVKQVLDKIKTDGLQPTLEAVFNKLGQPLPLGYCNVGVVEAVGRGVTEFHVGDRVASNGNHAEYVCVPKNLVAKVPDNVTDEQAAFTVIGSIGLEGIRLLKPELGETIVVVGLGLIGLIVAQLLRSNGCRVIGVEFDQAKLDLAAKWGVIPVNPAKGDDQVKVVEELTGGIGADGVIITASAHDDSIIHNACLMSRKRGRIVLVGVIGLNMRRDDFYKKELSFQVSCSYGPGRYDEDYENKGHDYPLPYVRWTEKRNFETILMAISNGGLDVNSLISEIVELQDYMQIYGVSKNPHKFTSRRNSQAATIVIFSSAYHLTEEYKDLPVEYAHYRNGEQMSEDYCWCPINDKVVIADSNGREVTPPFFNRNGLYQVVTKKYLKTIKYNENLYVLYQYIDPDDDEEEYQDDPQMAVLFGRSGLEVRHFPTSQAKEGEPVTDYDLEWQKDGRYIDWDKEEPQQGAIRLRVTVKGIVFKPKVYYVPFVPADASQQPIWRDFEKMRICTALNGVEDIQDDIKRLLTGEELSDTKQLKIGTDAARILVDVYRPVIVRELSQQKTGEEESKVIKYYQKDEDIHIPLIDCEQFSVRDFSENGVKEYQVKSRSTVYYNFPTFNQTSLSSGMYTEEHAAKELTPEIPLDYLKIYMTRPLDEQSELYAWDYKSDPRPVESANELTGEGIVFQSLIEKDSPRDYSMPTIKKKSGWGGKKDVVAIDALYCFETVAAHKTYFFLFSPLIKVIASQTQIQDIFLPLMKKRNYQLTEEDIDNLYRFAMQFHFDWMLLPRVSWKASIEAGAATDEEQEELKKHVTDFFAKTPKCSDERELAQLKDFLKRYWTFNGHPNLADVAEKAVKLILDDPDALGNQEMREFLKHYDDCRFKFIEMSKVVTKEEI